MPPSDSRKRPSAAAIARARQWLLRQQEITAGTLPSVTELMSGQPPLGGDWARDATAWCRSMLSHDELSDAGVREALELLAASFKIGPVRQALAAVEAWRDVDFDKMDDMREADDRLRIYAAALGENSGDWLRWQLLLSRQNPARAATTATLLGMIWHRQFHGLDAPMPQQWRGIGEDHLEGIMEELAESDAAREAVDAEKTRDADLPAEDDDGALDHLTRFSEDRAEIHRAGDMVERLRGGLRRTVKVMPGPSGALHGARAAAWKSFEGIAGKHLPLIERGDVGAHMISLAIEFPHARPQVATILRDLATSEVARLRPTLLVGNPGCGKTSLARAIAATIGLPSTIYSCAGQADSSLMGTSAQWSTARPSVPLDMIRTSRKANPLIVLDEIDKVGESKHNGSLVDALLAFLEPTTARRHRDLSLEVEVDLSHISWIATANDLRDVPAALRDRFRIIEIPDPTWRHIADLSKVILEDIARDRGVHPQWQPDLAQDELDVIKRAWPGGSLRRLRRAVEIIIDGRDALMGRA